MHKFNTLSTWVILYGSIGSFHDAIFRISQKIFVHHTNGAMNLWRGRSDVYTFTSWYISEFSICLSQIRGSSHRYPNKKISVTISARRHWYHRFYSTIVETHTYRDTISHSTLDRMPDTRHRPNLYRCRNTADADLRKGVWVNKGNKRYCQLTADDVLSVIGRGEDSNFPIYLYNLAERGHSMSASPRMMIPNCTRSQEDDS